MNSKKRNDILPGDIVFDRYSSLDDKFKNCYLVLGVEESPQSFLNDSQYRYILFSVEKNSIHYLKNTKMKDLRIFHVEKYISLK